MKEWGRTVLVLGVFWLLTRWVGMGALFTPDARSIALWSAVLLAGFLLWRDGRVLLARIGLSGHDAPLSILERRLAQGELSLDSYRALREELLSTRAGIAAANKNTDSKCVLRGDRGE
ncbi:MAG: hypothetical protein ACM3ZC_15375 [Bacteroidota bacterium]